MVSDESPFYPQGTRVAPKVCSHATPQTEARRPSPDVPLLRIAIQEGSISSDSFGFHSAWLVSFVTEGLLKFTIIGTSLVTD